MTSVSNSILQGIQMQEQISSSPLFPTRLLTPIQSKSKTLVSKSMKAKLVLYQTNWKQRRRKDPLITCNGL
jgi:hypothetical protein